MTQPAKRPTHAVTVLAPAKLNLTLDITGVTPDGYHTLDMFMQAVNLYERITVERSRGLTVLLPGSRVRGGPHNTAYQAAVAFFRHTGLLAGAFITIRKAVPVRAGMAGGSADAAGVLVALNELYGARLSREELCDIGAQVGADVPFSILGGTARVQGIGDVLRPAPCCPRCWFAVCMPAMGVSTPQAYALYDQYGARMRPDNEAAAAALAAGDLAGLCAAMGNALQESSPSRENGPICAVLRRHGALAAQMSGSGAAVFGVFDSEHAARAAREELAGSYPQCWVLHPVPVGARVLRRREKRGCNRQQHPV